MDTSAEVVKKQPKSVKALLSMFEQNIQKPVVANEKALSKLKTKLAINVFEQVL